MSLVEIETAVNLKLTPQQAMTMYRFFDKCFEVTQVYGDADKNDPEPEKKLVIKMDEFNLIDGLQRAIRASGIVINT